VVILLGRGRGPDLGNEVRQVVRAARGQLDRVADPVAVALAPVADFLVVGRAVPLADRQHLLGREPLGMTVDLALLLGPGLFADANGRELLAPGPLGLCHRLIRTREQRVAVCAMGRTERVALGLVFG
jgi:hypothetical protein